MQQTVQVGLYGAPHDLLEMMQRFNRACSWLSSIAFSEKTFHWLPLQRRAYHELRQRFQLTSVQATVAVRKVAYAYRYKARRTHKAIFRPTGSMPLHRHRYKRDGTIAFYGMRVPFVARAGVELSGKQQANLVYRDGRFYVYQVITVAEPEPYAPTGFLGCDLGIVKILADSDGQSYAGNHLNSLRHRHARLRRKLQKKGTRSAKRLLSKRRQREGRFARSVNHVISKRVVAKAKGTLRGIALENLKGIRERITVRKAQRRQQHSWAFQQLRFFIEYKAKLNGVPTALVDPRNTSRTCPKCGHCEKANRQSQEVFHCVRCHFSGGADHVAAINIAARAMSDCRVVGSQPYAALHAE